jgi:hypothetical protein
MSVLLTESLEIKDSCLYEDVVNLSKMMRIVLWSFLGVRRCAFHQADIAGVKLPFVTYRRRSATHWIRRNSL